MNTPAHRVDLPYTREAFLQVLRWGALGDASPYSHKQIAEWCDRFWCLSLEDDAPADIDPLLPILTSVETQWDLHFANTYSIEELRTRSFEEVRLPTDWFEEWIAQAQANSVKANGGET